MADAAAVEPPIAVEVGHGVDAEPGDTRATADTCSVGAAHQAIRLEAEGVDTLIFATGFSATKYLSAIDVVGRNGRRIDEAWNDGARAYLGITTSGFPNLFMLYGPNTNNGSILTMIEAQVEYAARQIRWIASDGLAWIDVRPEPMERYNEEIQRGIQGVEVWQADCHGYYRSPSGRIVTQWPFSMTEYRRRTEKPDAELYEVARLADAPLRSAAG